MADDYVRQGTTFRALDRGGKMVAVMSVVDGPEVVPTLTGATLVYAVDDSPAVALDPPDGGSQVAWIRVWHATQDSTKRLYYRRDGTAPTADGANAEGFLVHGEGRMVRLTTLTNFKMISETGAAHTVYAEFSNT